jgi:hypothetical protein
MGLSDTLHHMAERAERLEDKIRGFKPKEMLCHHEWVYIDVAADYKRDVGEGRGVTACIPSYDKCVKCGRIEYLGLMEESRTHRRAV